MGLTPSPAPTKRSLPARQCPAERRSGRIHGREAGGQCWAVLVGAEPLLVRTHSLVPRMSGGGIVITWSGHNLVLRVFPFEALYLLYAVDSFKHKHSNVTLIGQQKRHVFVAREPSPEGRAWPGSASAGQLRARRPAHAMPANDKKTHGIDFGVKTNF